MQASAPGKEGRKAFGTRDRVVECLLAHGDIRDSSGMASPRLAQAVGYTGSSIAFAQLLSGMERAGLITREVRGKRTYRVHLTAAGRERARTAGIESSAGPADAGREAGTHPTGASSGEGGSPDYDELAHRLLVQVARRLLSPPAGGAAATEPDAAGRRAPAAGPPPEAGGYPGPLEEKVAALEQELRAARAARNALRAENEDLREQLTRIRDNLDRAEARLRPRARPVTTGWLDPEEIALLQRLLAMAGGADSRASSA